MASELNNQQIEESKTVFDKYRIYQNAVLDEAKISAKDLFKALLELKFEISLEEVKEYIIKLNVPQEIDFSTFLRIAAIKFRERDFDKEIHEAFRSFDKKNKNYLTYDELKAIITDYGPKISSEGADDLLKDLGLESDKKFKYEDFVKNSL